MARLPSPNPRDVPALRALQEAVQCQRLGQNAAAERHFTQALQKRPDYFDALLHYGLFKYQQERLPGRPSNCCPKLPLLTRGRSMP